MATDEAGQGVRPRYTRRTGWAVAQPVVDGEGLRHASKLEKRVYDRLVLQARHDGAILFRQVRFPLLSLAPTATGGPLAITVDFVLVRGEQWRVIDAKPKRRKSCEWVRGKAAFEACYGVPIEEWDE